MGRTQTTTKITKHTTMNKQTKSTTYTKSGTKTITKQTQQTKP